MTKAKVLDGLFAAWFFLGWIPPMSVIGGEETLGNILIVVAVWAVPCVVLMIARDRAAERAAG